MTQLNARQRATIQRLAAQATEIAAAEEELATLTARRDQTLRTGAKQGIPVTQLAAAAGMPNPTAYRIVRTEGD